MADQHSSLPSRLLHAVDQWSGRAWLAVLLSAVTGAAAITLVATMASSRALSSFAAIIESVTLAMVFVVQHTQDREQTITQRKLDELLRTQHHTDDRVINLENASDDEIDALSDRHETHRPN